MNKETVMNGPAKFNMEVYVVNDETGQAGTVTIGLGAFEYPSKRKVAERMATVENELKKQGLDGFRLATKHEAFEALCIERVGEPMALADSNEWDDI